MDFIKNKQKFIEATNEVINSCGGTPDQIAKDLDELIFDYLLHSTRDGGNISAYETGEIYTLKRVRDLFLIILESD